MKTKDAELRIFWLHVNADCCFVSVLQGADFGLDRTTPKYNHYNHRTATPASTAAHCSLLTSE